MKENEIAAIEVHRTLGGPGLLEVVDEEALTFEVESRGLTVTRQRAVPLMYKGRRLASDLRPRPLPHLACTALFSVFIPSLGRKA